MNEPVFNGYNAPRAVIRQLSLFVGYLIHKEGGTITLPPFEELIELLEDKFQFKFETKPDGTSLLTLQPLGTPTNGVGNA